MGEGGRRHRLVTRGDFDGLVSAVLLRHLDQVEEIVFVRPRDVQAGRVALSAGDITTNLPYVESVHLAFVHHLSEALRHETLRREACPDNLVIDPRAPSAARVVYEHFGADSFPRAWDEMLDAVDKADAARFTMDDVLHPQGWVMLSFLIDARSGLERLGGFRIGADQLMLDLIDYCARHGIDEMFAQPDLRERILKYFEYEKPFREQLERCSTLRGDVVVLDLRQEAQVFPGNRFLVYALNRAARLSVTVLPDEDRDGTVLAMGKSIFDRTSPVNVAELMLGHGGGGHENAGTCVVPDARVDEVLEALLEQAATEAVT